MLVLNSCKKDKPDAPDVDPSLSFKALKTHLIANNLDLPTILTGWVTPADAVQEIQTDADATNDYYIIDIRAAADYAAGHIPTAVNATLGTVLDQAAASGGKDILIACYSGQSAGHAVAALRLSGYPTAKVLKWGMAGWNSNYAGSWDNACKDLGSSNWVAAPGSVAGNTSHGDPEYTTTATDGAAILTERIAGMLAGGFKGIASVDVLASPSNFFINNYWATTDIEKYGNITGAYQIKPLSLAGGEYANMDPTKKVITYCWTGQTSSMITAYLTVLGYDAASLKNGANSMIHANLEKNKWSASYKRDYPVVVSGASAQSILEDYIVANNLDLNDMLTGWVKKSSDIYAAQTDADATNDFYIIDIRQAAHYAEGHIEGAVNSTLANIITTAEGSDGKQIAVTCYSGQSAAHAVMALRLSGYTNTISMKWGMSGWSASLAGSWNGNISNFAKTHANWTATTSFATNASYELPSISSASTTGEGILAERVGYMITNGFKGINATDVVGTPGDYFINNYWSEAIASKYGNIAGAYRINPLTIENNEIKGLDPTKKVVTYCWTGQTSSMITAYLTVLGYDAVSLKNGANAMINEDLEENKWVTSETKDYPLVTSK